MTHWPNMTVSSQDIEVVTQVAAAHSVSGLLTRFSIEIAIGAFALIVALLRFMGKNALQDIRTLKEERHLIVTKEDMRDLLNEMRSEIKLLDRRIDGIYSFKCPHPQKGCPIQCPGNVPCDE